MIDKWSKTLVGETTWWSSGLVELSASMPLSLSLSLSLPAKVNVNWEFVLIAVLINLSLSLSLCAKGIVNWEFVWVVLVPLLCAQVTSSTNHNSLCDRVVHKIVVLKFSNLCWLLFWEASTLILFIKTWKDVQKYVPHFLHWILTYITESHMHASWKIKEGCTEFFALVNEPISKHLQNIPVKILVYIEQYRPYWSLLNISVKKEKFSRYKN